MPAALAGLVLGLPFAGALAVWLVGDARPRARDGVAVASALAAALAGLLLTTMSTSDVVLRYALGPSFGDVTLVPDALGTLMAAIATSIGAMTVIFSLDYMGGERGLARYYALVLLFIGAMAGLVLTGSLLVLLACWELVGLCSFALIAFHADRPAAVAGGVRALLVTQLGGVGLVIGILVARAELGSYEIMALLDRAGALPNAALALVAFGFLAAAAAKSAQVPFHTWLPGAMEAPTPISALIHAATMVNAGVYLLARFQPAFAPVPGWSFMVVTIGVGTALLAGTMALESMDVKRVLAYSTMSQLGYLFYGVGAGAVLASQLHLLSHALFKALLFLAAGAVVHQFGTRDLARLGGAARRMPIVALAFAVGGGALVGVPPIGGFWSKELLLGEAGATAPGWAPPAMLAATALTALYAARLLYNLLLAPSRGDARRSTPLGMRLALLPLMAATLASSLLTGPLTSALALDLPWHHLEPLSTARVHALVASSSDTYVALGATALGLLLWWGRARTVGLARALAPLRRAAAAGFGADWFERRVVQVVAAAAALGRSAQTGRLAWNVAGVTAGLAIVVAALVAGGPS